MVVLIGAGQLARMTAAPAAALDVELRVLAASASDCAAAVVPGTVVGDWDDDAVVARVAGDADVITFDHELVDARIVQRWEKAGHVVWPSSATLAVAADKAAQRHAMEAGGLPVPPYGLATTVAEVEQLGTGFGWPLVVKAARGGYDGRGVWWLGEPAEAGPVLEGLPDGVPLVVEPVLDLAAELAVQVARTADGRTVVSPAVRTHQADGICREVVAPSGLAPEVEREAQQLALRVAEAVDAVGMLAVEFFVVGDRLLVNELAPRAHNSGHYGIEACVTSQFENHLRAVLGLPLGEPGLRVPAAAMVNVLGGPVRPIRRVRSRWRSAIPTRRCTCTGRLTGRVASSVTSPCAPTTLRPRWPGPAPPSRPSSRDGDRGRASLVAPTGGPAPQRPEERWPMSVAVVMGSDSDLTVMEGAVEVLESFGVDHLVKVVSAHRDSRAMLDFAAGAAGAGIEVIIAGAGGAAHLPGMIASATPLPVIGVPVSLRNLDGLDSLLSIVQMPKGVPVATMAIDGAANAGLLAVRILAVGRPELRAAVEAHLEGLRDEVAARDARAQERLAERRPPSA